MGLKVGMSVCYGKSKLSFYTHGLHGFVEGTDVISIEAAHTLRKTSVPPGISCPEIPGYGRTLSGTTPMPFTDTTFGVGTGPTL
jgi:hypothetical protein